MQCTPLVEWFTVSCLMFFCVIRWVEEDPTEILQSVKTCIEKAVENLKSLSIDPTCIKGLFDADIISWLTVVAAGL